MLNGRSAGGTLTLSTPPSVTASTTYTMSLLKSGLNALACNVGVNRHAFQSMKVPLKYPGSPSSLRVDQWLCCSTWPHRRLRYCLLCCLRSLNTNFSLTDPHSGVSLLAEIKHGPQGVITFRAHRMAQARRTHAMYRTPELFVHALKHEILQ